MLEIDLLHHLSRMTELSECLPAEKYDHQVAYLTDVIEQTLAHVQRIIMTKPADFSMSLECFARHLAHDYMLIDIINQTLYATLAFF